MTVTRTSVEGNKAPVGPDVFNLGGTFTRNGEVAPPTMPGGGATSPQDSAATTWSMQAHSAATSSGSTAGNMPTRTWLRPSLR